MYKKSATRTIRSRGVASWVYSVHSILLRLSRAPLDYQIRLHLLSARSFPHSSPHRSRFKLWVVWQGKLVRPQANGHPAPSHISISLLTSNSPRTTLNKSPSMAATTLSPKAEVT